MAFVVLIVLVAAFWLATPLLATPIGWHRCRGHVVARRRFGGRAVVTLASYDGVLVVCWAPTVLDSAAAWTPVLRACGLVAALAAPAIAAFVIFLVEAPRLRAPLPGLRLPHGLRALPALSRVRDPDRRRGVRVRWRR
ncbi:MAG: hypothetical protein ACYTG1_01045 [Planctomycetota bacterium]